MSASWQGRGAAERPGMGAEQPSIEPTLAEVNLRVPGIVPKRHEYPPLPLTL